MSRGPGKVQRAIEATFAATPDAIFLVEELVAIAYPVVDQIERKHRSAVVRAVKCMETRTGWSTDIHKAYGHRRHRDYRPVIVFNLNSGTSMAAARRLHEQMSRHGREALRQHRQTLARA